MKPMKSLATALAVSALVTGSVALGALSLSRTSVAAKSVFVPLVPTLSPSGHVRCNTPNPTLETTQRLNAAAQGGISTVSDNPISPLKSARTVNRSVGIILPPNGVSVPVYVHVVGTRSYQPFVRDAAIAAQIDVMNQSFAGKQPKPAGQIASGQPIGVSPYRFQLMSINRVISNFQLSGISGFYNGRFVWNKDEYEFRKGLRRGGANALNIYLCEEPAGLLGTATFPSDYANLIYTYNAATQAYVLESGQPVDGIIVGGGTIPGGYIPDYDGGDTAVHEIGHWLGLYHTFQSDLTQPSAAEGCVTTGDFVPDTPAERTSYFGLEPVPVLDTCTGPRFPGRDPFENFMDYSDDDVLYQFTPGQVARMRTINSKLRRL